VYLVFPLLILWSNLHGSAIIGVALAVLYGVSLLVADLRGGRGLRVRRRGLVFIVAAPLCLLATPYGIAGAAYYHETLGNPVFKALVTEWRPITSSAALAVPFFISAFATVWLLGQARGRARLFEALALLALIAVAISAVRNITWFGLAATVLLPSMIGGIAPEREPAPRRPRVNLALAGGGLVALLISFVAVAVKPISWFEHGYDQRALNTVVAEARDHPGMRVFADVHFGDWLLWHAPALAGRVAYDARLELLTPTQLSGLTTLTQTRLPGAPDLLAGYGLFVFETKDSDTLKLMLQRTGARVLLRGHGVVVAARPGA
jgi:hypothetical protein